MVYGGKRFINQFPNRDHLEFINTLLSLPELDDNADVALFGGKLSQSFITTAKDYILSLSDVPEALGPSGQALAQVAAWHGIPTMTGLFLRDISPRDVQDQRDNSFIAQTYKSRTTEVRQTLFESARIIASPGLIFEYLMSYLQGDELYAFEGNRVIQFIWALREHSGDQYHEYQSLLQKEVKQLTSERKRVPEEVVRAI